MRKVISTSQVLWGIPRLENTRLSVYDIIMMLWNNEDVNYTLKTYEISKEEVKEALSYCINRMCIKNDVLNYCDGCIIRSIKDKNTNVVVKFNMFLEKLEEEKKGELGKIIEEINDEEVGFAGWRRAKILLNVISK